MSMEGDRVPLYNHSPSSTTIRPRIGEVCVLISVTLERLVYYGIVMNLYLYLNRGDVETEAWTPAQAMSAVFVLTGASYIFSPVGGWLADAVLGRFWTIFIGYVVYIFSLSFMAAIASENIQLSFCNFTHHSDGRHFSMLDVNETHRTPVLPTYPPCGTVMYILLTLLGVGVSIVRVNLIPFGVEQVQHEGSLALQDWLTCFYLCINVGSSLGITLLSLFMQNFPHGFFIAYLVCLGCMLVSAFVFMMGYKYYVLHRPAGSLIFNVLRIIKYALKKRWHKGRYLGTQGSSLLDDRNDVADAKPPCWLDLAKIEYGGPYHTSVVDNVKILGKISLIFMTFIPYFLVFFQMETSFLAQGLHMSIPRVSSDIKHRFGFQVPVAWLSLFDQAFVYLLAPLLKQIIYPILRRFDLNVPLFVRIVIGMTFSSLAVLTAGVVEVERKQGPFMNQTISGTVYDASTMSVFWQVPQYCLMGTAGLVTTVAGLQYAYSASPKVFQSMIMGLFNFFEGVGSFLGPLLVIAFPAWVPDQWSAGRDFNNFGLQYYFFLLAGLQMLPVIIISIWGKHSYEIPDDDDVSSTHSSEEGDTGFGYN